MMLKLFFHIILLIPVFLNAQVNIVNRSLTDSSLNIAYIDVRNILELKGYKGSNKLIFSTTNGTLMDLGQNQYVLTPFEKRECVLTFKDKEKTIAQETFKVDVIPDPLPRFSSQYDSINKKGHTYYISFNNLMKDLVFRIETPNCYFKQPWQILSYRITLDNLSGDGTITEFTVKGPEPTKEQIQIIKNHGPNTFMTIEEIRAEGPDSRARLLVPQIFMIR